jgi:DNA replication protein DnaC
MLKDLLLSLRMFGALESLEAFARLESKEEYVAAILKAELEHRQLRQEKKRLKRASFPSEKEWAEIDKKLNPEIDFESVKALGNGDFVRRKENLCIIGHQGTGKSHSLVALGRELCRQGISVQFCTAHSLVTSLEEAQDEHKLGKMMTALMKPSLLIIDELGFVPFTKKGSSLLFDVFAKRYEKGSIAVSTNLIFDKWVNLFRSMELTAALLDRFTHRAHIFVYKGESVRFLTSKQRMEQQARST